MMITNKSRGIYIHVPFCLSKCPYCDFYSVPRQAPELIAGFCGALEAEIRGRATSEGSWGYGACAGAACAAVSGLGAAAQAAEPRAATRETEAALVGFRTATRSTVQAGNPTRRVDSIYFGGGTPCLLTESQFEQIMACLRDCFDIAPDAEISMEANPAAVTETKLRAFRAAGLNRLSIGAQSFDDDMLKLLGRLHKVHQITETVEAARRAGFENISLDLMFGIDGQTQETWERSVTQAIALAPEHISLYSLEIMDNTRFARDEEKGIYHQTEPELDRKMYHAALDMLEAAGYMQYEISNVARPGFECRHNLRYWDMGEYIGFGPAAHSFVGGARYSNAADVNAYIASGGRPEICGRVQNTEQDNISEYIFTGLRKNVGISKKDFRERFGAGIWEFYSDAERREFQEFVSGGFAEESEEYIRLTRRGMDISNRIMAIFV